MTPRRGVMRDGAERRTDTGRAVSHSRKMGEMRDVLETQTLQDRSVSRGREMRDGAVGLARREMGIGRGGTR